MITPPPIPAFSDIETRSMLDATPSAWWRAFINVGIASGLRVSEALWLSWADIDSSHGSIKVVFAPVNTPCSGPLPRPSVRIHRERVVSAPPEVLNSLAELREAADPGSLVFIPGWRLDRLWPSLLSGERLRSYSIAPGLSSHFAWIQRMARHCLAVRLDVPLADVKWPLRPLSALRETFASRIAAELAACLGVRRSHGAVVPCSAKGGA